MKHLLLLVLLLVFTLPAQAQAPQRPPSLTKAEQYLNSLTTAQARFLQTAGDGSQAIGTFYLNRPGKLRFEYDDPIEDFVVADGFLVYFYDAQLGEQTNAPIGQTLADFLLRPNLSLSGEIKVTDIKRSGGLLQIALVQADDPEAGMITLGFNEEPMELKKWRIADSTGAVTEVELFQLKTGLELADSLFVYADPKRFEKRYND